MQGHHGVQQPQHVVSYQPQQPVVPPAAQLPVLPPSPEGTAFAGVLGGGAAALATQGIMFLGNWEPQSVAANVLITAGAAAFGGTASAIGYRMSANRAYQAAQQASQMSGVDPSQAASSLRVSGKLGRWGKVNIDVPSQTITEAAKIWNNLHNPNTPTLVHDYFDRAAAEALQRASGNFQTCMPPAQQAFMPQPPQQPQPQQYAYVQAQPVYYQAPPAQQSAYVPPPPQPNQPQYAYAVPPQQASQPFQAQPSS